MSNGGEILARSMWCQYLLIMLQYSGHRQFAASIWSISAKILEPLVLWAKQYLCTKIKTGAFSIWWKRMIGYLVVEAICFGLSKECLCHAHINIRLLSNIVENFAAVKYCVEFCFNIAAVKYCWEFFFNIDAVEYCWEFFFNIDAVKCCENFSSILLLSNIVENFSSILLLSNVVENFAAVKHCLFHLSWSQAKPAVLLLLLLLCLFADAIT